MMKKFLHLIFIGVLILGSISIKAQEVTFPYNGTTNLTVNSSSNVNQGIKINFNDLDVVNNFFTQNQNTIYMYIALETNNVLSSWEYPYGSINNTATLIAVPLNADNNVGASPNNYSVTINPRDYFTAVPAGTTVYGYHVLFRNQFGVGGNNQTVDLYIDLQDAVYSTTCIGGNGNYDDADCDGILNSCDFDDDNDGIPDISESTCTLSGQTVRIGYIPNSRDLDPDNGYTFDGTYMIDSGTLKLANLANFGPAGTVKANVVFVPISANPITKADISALNLNIVFIGGIDDLSLNSYISAAELNAVKDWSDDSPRNVVVVSQFQALQWGASVVSGNVNPNTPTPLGVVSPIFNGPFGTVSSFTQGGGFQAYFDSVLSCSQQSLARDGSGRTTVYIDGVYNDILLSDIDILTSLGGVTFGNAITSNNDKLFANIWAFAINQSLCLGLDSDGDLIPNQFDLDSDNDGCLDALEGDENVTTGQLVTASGSVTTGSSASNQNLGNTVDSNGVPTIVNSGGTADIGGDQGQGAGSTQNSASKDPQCLKFGCTSAMYLSQNTPAALYDINTASNPFTFPQIGANSGINYNSIGVNPLDGFIYGTIVNSNQIIRIYSDGTYTNLGAVTGLPVLTYNSGEIDDLGNYYVKQNTNNNTLYKINLTTLTATSQTLTASINVPDMAYNVVTDLLYGVNSTNGQLISINPTTGAVVGIGITPGAVSFGGMFGSSTGEIYGVSNAGGFYQFNLTTGQRVLISGAPSSAANDGAHCVTAPIAFAADLSVTKTDGKTQYLPGTTNTYTIVARNEGPFGVVNASVVDNVPTGIPAANMSYTAVASSGSSTSVVGTQIGAINDLVSLPFNGTVTYTVTITIPSSYTGDLVNTVTITPPSNATDSDLTDNTATDTDTLGACYNAPNTGTAGIDTKHGITLLKRAGTDNGNWPMIRKSAHTVLESNTKGFVITRMASPETAITNPQEGMMVYDTDNLCLKIYDGTSWSCFTTPACP